MAGMPRPRTIPADHPAFASLPVSHIVLAARVRAAVHVSGHLPIGLLGMSFLNRMQMQRDGAALTLTRRY